MLDPVERVEALFAASEWRSRANKMYQTLNTNNSLRKQDRIGIKKEADLFNRTANLLTKAAEGKK